MLFLRLSSHHVHMLSFPHILFYHFSDMPIWVWGFLFICLFCGASYLLNQLTNDPIFTESLKQIKCKCIWVWKGMNLASSQLPLSQLWNDNLRSQRVPRIHSISKELRSSPKRILFFKPIVKYVYFQLILNQNFSTFPNKGEGSILEWMKQFEALNVGTL